MEGKKGVEEEVRETRLEESTKRRATVRNSSTVYIPQNL
jgi:hypothetical protein